MQHAGGSRLGALLYGKESTACSPSPSAACLHVQTQLSCECDGGKKGTIMAGWVGNSVIGMSESESVLVTASKRVTGGRNELFLTGLVDGLDGRGGLWLGNGS